jgi:hypothetical protein
VERSKVVRGRSLNGKKLESSGGIVPSLLIMMTCVKDGRIDGDANDNDGTRCLNNGMCEREFNFGTVMNIFAPKQMSTFTKEGGSTNCSQCKFKFFLFIGWIKDS